MSAWAWIAVGLAGGAGSVARMTGTLAIGRDSPPVGTLVINISGALALGVVSGAGLTGHGRLLVGTALIGSFTTFSTLMHETTALTGEGRRGQAARLLAVSIVAGLGAVALGHWLGGLF